MGNKPNRHTETKPIEKVQDKYPTMELAKHQKEQQIIVKGYIRKLIEEIK